MHFYLSMSLEGYFIAQLVFGITAFSLQCCLDATRHRLVQLVNVVYRDLIPLLLDNLPEITNASRSLFSLSDLDLEIMPNVLNQVQVWGLL